MSVIIMTQQGFEVLVQLSDISRRLNLPKGYLFFRQSHSWKQLN